MSSPWTLAALAPLPLEVLQTLFGDLPVELVVPHERTQSLGLKQGPIQRKLRVASMVVHSTAGPVHPMVEHLDEHVAAALLDEQTVRARTARAGALPEQWMRRPEAL